jgi:hypothetical protein
MLVCIGYEYYLDRYEISNYWKLTPALDMIYGEGKVEWDIRGRLLRFTSDTEDLVGLRDILRMLGVLETKRMIILVVVTEDYILQQRATPTWKQLYLD